mmetsp:Transcript_9567/g.11563  ORF Transcript_9567/g.11563 Transcript_9567/m.11563 type:complete len:431 (-) Transcript_9567:127-1419(-)
MINHRHHRHHEELSYKLAPGHVPSAGCYRGLSVEFSGRGLVAPLVAITSLPNIMINQKNLFSNQNQNKEDDDDTPTPTCQKDIYGYFGGIRRSVGNILGGDVHYSKWGTSIRSYHTLTPPYIYKQPIYGDTKQNLKNLFYANKISSYLRNHYSNNSHLYDDGNQGMNETEFISSNQKALEENKKIIHSNQYQNQNHLNSKDMIMNEEVDVQYGIAAGLILNTSFNLSILCPYAKQPLTKKTYKKSNLCDRFFLGGSKKDGYNNMMPGGGSSFHSRVNGSLPFLSDEEGLRGFANSGVGPRSTSATTASTTSTTNTSTSQDATTSGGLLGGDALGGDVRVSGSMELSAPIPIPQLAAAGFRSTAALQAGVLVEDLASCSLSDSLRASGTVGVGLPLGSGAHVEFLCSHPFKMKSHDKPEKWQISVSLGIGS